MSQPIILLADRLIRGTDAPLIEESAILIQDGSIVFAGRREEFVPPENAKIIDCGDRTLLPGLVDCHEHLLGRGRYAESGSDFNEPEAAWGVVFAHQSDRVLRTGITTVRVPGTYRGIDLAVRGALAELNHPSPRLICAGQAITMTGGHGSGAGVQVDGIAECMRATRAELAAGADFIKVIASGGVGTIRIGEDPTHPEFTVEELSAVVTAARSAGKYVTAHADGIEGIENALHAGVQCIEHGIYLTMQQAEKMAKDGVHLVPTLSTMVNIARKTEEWGLPSEWAGTAEEILDVHRASFQAALDAGVKFGTGTDGYGDMVDEIREFTSYGLTPLRAIQAATQDAAQIALPGANFGTLESGQLADIIAVDGNPLDDLEALRSVAIVLTEGAVVFDPMALSMN